MEIVENRLLVFKTRNPERYSLIPKSKAIPRSDGGYDVAVYWSLDEARVLRNLGVKNVPSPIYGRYDWPGRYTPMAHQKETASFLTLHRRAFVFNDPGTGKTLSALWAADYLMKRGDVRRVLILCPLSIMHSAWMQDLGNSVIHRSAVVAHHAQAARRIELIQENYEFVIINYEGLALIANEVKADGRFDLVIVDEANAYKNPQTKRWKALASILKPDTYLWMMTGTPASQSPVDAYGLAKLVNPNGVPKFYTAWRDAVMNKITMFKWAPKLDAADKVFEVLQPAIRYSKAQCLDLPPVVTMTREVPLTPQQAKYYNLLKTQMLVMAAGETITAVNAAAALNKLLQISAGVAYTDNKEVVEFDATPRLNVLMEALEQTERKVIIFALFRSAIDAISEFLNKNGIANEQIHGGVTATKRGDIIKRFQTQPNPRVLVMQPAATAHGITLTAADTVIFYGPLMSVEQYTQCVARADRKGQDSDKVTVIHIEGSPVEKKMFKALTAKVDDNALLVDLFNNEIKERGL
jgi:SNF2 family DNA or RNA helicase